MNEKLSILLITALFIAAAAALVAIIWLVYRILSAFRDAKRYREENAQLRMKLKELGMKVNSLTDTTATQAAQIRRGFTASTWAMECEIDALRGELKKKDRLLKTYRKEIERRA